MLAWICWCFWKAYYVLDWGTRLAACLVLWRRWLLDGRRERRRKERAS